MEKVGFIMVIIMVSIKKIFAVINWVTLLPFFYKSLFQLIEFAVFKLRI
jgi:hypothetical protein